MVDAVFVGFALLLVLASVVLFRNLRRILDNPKPVMRPASDAPPPKDAWLRREVLDEDGLPRGETVAFEGEALVFRSMARYFVVPRSTATLEGDTVRVRGVDWDRAEARGKSWQSEHLDIVQREDPFGQAPEG